MHACPVCLAFSLSVCQSVCLSVCLSLCSSVCLSCTDFGDYWQLTADWGILTQNDNLNHLLCNFFKFQADFWVKSRFNLSLINPLIVTLQSQEQIITFSIDFALCWNVNQCWNLGVLCCNYVPVRAPACLATSFRQQLVKSTYFIAWAILIN